MNQQIPIKKELATALVAKAENDPVFRKALVSDAKSAVERELGGPLPPGLQIKALEETEGMMYLVLPPADRGELSDADLSAVSGGTENAVNLGMVRSFIKRVMTPSTPSGPETPTPAKGEEGFKKADHQTGGGGLQGTH